MGQVVAFCKSPQPFPIKPLENDLSLYHAKTICSNYATALMAVAQYLAALDYDEHLEISKICDQLYNFGSRPCSK